MENSATLSFLRSLIIFTSVFVALSAQASWIALRSSDAHVAVVNLQIPEPLASSLIGLLADDAKTVVTPKYASRILLQTDSEGRFISSRPVSVLMHGFFSWPGYYAQLQKELLAKGHHVLNMRLPGHFDKDYASLDLVTAADFADFADDVFRVADQFEGSLHLVGHSAGGFLVTDLARRHPDRVSSLLLFGPALQIGRHVLSFTDFATTVGLSWKDLIFWHKDPTQIYRSTVAARELNKLCKVRGFPRWGQEDWVKPLRHMKILMFNTQLETVIRLPTNLKFAKMMKDEPNFEHVLFPISSGILHDKLGKLSEEKHRKSWDKIRSFLQPANLEL